MSENIEGGTYGEVVDSAVADSLFTPDEGEQQTSATTSETNSEVTTDEQVETQETEQPESSEETVPTEDNESEDYQFSEIDIDGNIYTTEQLQELVEKHIIEDEKKFADLEKQNEELNKWYEKEMNLNPLSWRKKKGKK